MLVINEKNSGSTTRLLVGLICVVVAFMMSCTKPPSEGEGEGEGEGTGEGEGEELPVVVFRTQEQLDNYAFSLCENLITIDGPIVDLTPLAVVEAVRQITIRNTSITTLSGLGALRVTGGIFADRNSLLEKIEGLAPKLEHIADFSIGQNELLTDVVLDWPASRTNGLDASVAPALRRLEWPALSVIAGTYRVNPLLPDATNEHFASLVDTAAEPVDEFADGTLSVPRHRAVAGAAPVAVRVAGYVHAAFLPLFRLRARRLHDFVHKTASPRRGRRWG